MRAGKWLLLTVVSLMVLAVSAVAATSTADDCRTLADYRSAACAADAASLDIVAVDAETAQDVEAFGARRVNVVTEIEFVPNETLALNFFFDPESITVQRGKRVRWVQVGPLADPHTVTIVEEEDVPSTLEEMEACFAEDGACTTALEAHDPGNDGEPPFNNRVNVGGGGLDSPGDSLLLAPPPGSRISARVTASAGTTLHYICAIHPWMQGEIIVE